MMAQSRTESTRDTCNYGQYINQFPQNTIKVIREFERIQKKICRHKMSIMFNEICINEEMLPKYTYIYNETYKEVKLVTLVDGDLKAPFSIATRPRCRGGRYSIPWIGSTLPLIYIYIYIHIYINIYIYIYHHHY